MNYGVFEQMQAGAYGCRAGESAQAYMERTFLDVCVQKPQEEQRQINDMLNAAYCGCNAAEKTITLESTSPTIRMVTEKSPTTHGKR